MKRAFGSGLFPSSQSPSPEFLEDELEVNHARSWIEDRFVPVLQEQGVSGLAHQTRPDRSRLLFCEFWRCPKPYERHEDVDVKHYWDATLVGEGFFGNRVPGDMDAQIVGTDVPK